MRVIITGAGISGSLSAWYLARRGIEVTVIERNAGVAQEASAANAGQLAYQSVYPMGGPEFLREIPGVLCGLDSVIRIRDYLDPALWKWGLAFLRECTRRRAAANRDALQALAAESRELLRDIVAQAQIDFGLFENGRVRLYDTYEELDAAEAECEMLRARYGHEFDMLAPEECHARNPLLMGREGDLAGGVFLPGDATGDTVPLCEGIRQKLSGPEYRVDYRFNSEVVRLIGRGATIEGLELAGGEVVKGDAYLFCAGAESPRLLRRFGARLNLYPVKGCSVIFPNEKYAELLATNVTDATRRIVLAPMRGAIKLSTGMVFAGHDRADDPRLLNYLRIAGREIIPVLDFAQAQIHTGLRPAMPSSLPIVKRAGKGNIYLNTGHGMWGWLLAPATARRAAELIAGPEGGREGA